MKKIFNIKNFSYIVILIGTIFVFKNFLIINLHYVLSNLAVRDAFYLSNDINFKGIRDPGKKRYINLIFENYNNIKNFNFNILYEKIKKNKAINFNETEFNSEFDIIRILHELSKLNNYDKKKSAIYIPLNVKEYWLLSCDKYISSFVSTAISNIVMLKGLVYDLDSCYGHEKDYGFARYKYYKKKYATKNLSRKEICNLAITEGLIFVYTIQRQKNKYKYIKYNCLN